MCIEPGTGELVSSNISLHLKGEVIAMMIVAHIYLNTEGRGMRKAGGWVSQSDLGVIESRVSRQLTTGYSRCRF